MIKIVTIIGARPQFIKAAVVSNVFKNSNLINEIILHTGQHFDFKMNDIFFEELSLPVPKYNLGINSLSHGAMTGQMLKEIEIVLKTEKPDYIIVYGDTNSTLAGALAAKKLHIKVVHVEAGLRSFNMKMPEEINRILTDRISDILFCPTSKAVENLRKEGFENFDCSIYQSGDVMFDVALSFQKQNHTENLPVPFNGDEKYILCTIHREENTNQREKLKSIVSALNRINKEIKIILSLHPRTRNILLENNLKFDFKTYEPFGYFDMMKLLQKSTMVITDSGGLQKEAFFFKKNCITLREETEWTELVENGFNVLTGRSEELIYNSYKNFINKENNFDKNFYGCGDAGEKILSHILEENKKN